MTALMFWALVSVSAVAALPNRKFCSQKFFHQSLGAVKSSFFDGGKTMLEDIALASTTSKVPVTDHLRLLRDIDLSNADNFWDGTLPTIRRLRTVATQEKNMNQRIKVEETYNQLMKVGFDRRISSEKREDSPLKSAALRTSFQLELGKSKAEQLADLKKKRLEQRSGLIKFIPPSFHKYIDYLSSLRKDPKPQELGKNAFLGAFFSFVVWANMSARSSFMYFVVGNLVIMSLLLTRNMPKVNVAPGMDKRKVATWSSMAFKTAVAITLAFGGITSIISSGLLATLPFSGTAKAKAVMILSLLSNCYFTSFYEVFEEKGKSGWRWAKAQENALPADVEAKLADQVYGENKLYDLFDYNYDPQIDDYPPQPKYIDDRDDGESDVDRGGGSGELDEDDSKEHFENWRKERKEARRPPVEDAPPEAKWVGGKEGLYVKNVPTWLSSAYKQNVLKANRWRDKPQKYAKDTREFEPIPGPFGFRDKRPEWMEIFGTGVWEEKVTASRRAARAFGSYRKTMWKIDKQVVLLPCDGADKS